MIALGLFPLPSSPDGPEPSAAPASPSRRLSRWATGVALLPIPLWFIVATLRAPAPAWRAEYRENTSFGGSGVVMHERELQRYWDKNNPGVPGGLSTRSFAARWDTCLTLREARDIPLMLVADGNARLDIDGAERIRVESTKGMRATRGDIIRLEPGPHHLHVELQPRGWPSIALLASFDGRPPRAIGSGEMVAGVQTTLPGGGLEPCRGR